VRIFNIPIELIILDVDGVLIDVLAGLERNLKLAALHFDLPITPIKNNFKAVRLGKTRSKGNARDSTRMLWPELSEKEITQFVDYFYVVERMHSYPLIEGSIETIEFFYRRGVPLALCTNNPKKILAWRLEATGIDQSMFAAITTMDDAYRKPHPKAFDPIFSVIRAKREHTIYVGDLQIDYDAAKKAGIVFIAVLSGGVPSTAFCREGVLSTHIIERLSDILLLIHDQ